VARPCLEILVFEKQVVVRPVPDNPLGQVASDKKVALAHPTLGNFPAQVVADKRVVENLPP
jgi:hypothetical protein